MFWTVILAIEDGLSVKSTACWLIAVSPNKLYLYGSVAIVYHLSYILWYPNLNYELESMEYILGGPALDQTVGRLVIAPCYWHRYGVGVPDPDPDPDCGPDLLTSGLMGGSSQWLMAIRWSSGSWEGSGTVGALHSHALLQCRSASSNKYRNYGCFSNHFCESLRQFFSFTNVHSVCISWGPNHKKLEKCPFRRELQR